MLKPKKKRTRYLQFVIGCAGCLKVIKDEKFFIPVNKKGIPTMTDVKKIYDKPKMQVAAKCTLCKRKKLRPLVFL